LTFNGLHGVISQKKQLFITIVVRTSDPTKISVITKVKRHSDITFFVMEMHTIFW
jgi:hypothetical protein